MPDSDSKTSLTEMGRAGLEFVEQFELESVLGKFENELLKVAAEKCRQPSAPSRSSPGG